MTNRDMIEHLVNAGIDELIDEYVASVADSGEEEGDWNAISALEDAGIALESALDIL